MSCNKVELLVTSASCMTAISENICLQPKDSISQERLVKETQDTSDPDIPKSPKLDYTGTRWFVLHTQSICWQKNMYCSDYLSQLTVMCVCVFHSNQPTSTIISSQASICNSWEF